MTNEEAALQMLHWLDRMQEKPFSDDLLHKDGYWYGLRSRGALNDLHAYPVDSFINPRQRKVVKREATFTYTRQTEGTT